MIYQNFVFDEDTNYTDVYNTVKSMFSDLNSQGGCCTTPKISKALCSVNSLLIAADIDLDNGDTVRYKEDVKCAYLILKSFFRLSANPDVRPVVPFPDEALTDIENGRRYFSALNSEYIGEMQKGCDCKPLAYDCLMNTLKAVEYKNELNEYDDIAKKNLDIMLKIIGEAPIVETMTGYWWLSDEGDEPLTQSEILDTNSFNFSSGSSFTVPFVEVVYKALNIAYPNSEPSRTSYTNIANPDDFGTLGGGGDLLGSVVNTGIFKQQNGNYVVNGDRTLIFS